MTMVQQHLPNSISFRRVDLVRVLVVAAALAILPVAHAVGPVVALERVSVTSGGGSMQGDSFHSVISADGRYVAFDSASNDLVPGTTHLAAEQRVASAGDSPIKRRDDHNAALAFLRSDACARYVHL